MLSILTVLLSSVPFYDDIPKPRNKDIVACRKAFDELEDYVADVNGYVWKHDVDRGGFLTWEQGNTIRNEVRLSAQPYLDRIRYIGWQGASSDCNKLSRAGQNEVFATLKLFFK